MTRQQLYIFRVWTMGLIAGLFAMKAGAVGQSLWMQSNNHERGYFADPIASNIGDILTVTFDESLTGNNKKEFKSGSKAATINNSVTQFLFPAATSGFGTHAGNLPANNISGNNTYAAAGEINNTMTRGGTASVTVIDKLPNGNLVIEGMRKVSFSDEELYMLLTGIVRAIDISHENTINSTLIADARLEFLSEGSVTAMQKKGWLMKLNDRINPF